MPTLGELRLKLGCKGEADDPQTFQTPAEAVTLLPVLPAQDVMDAATALLAQSALNAVGVSVLLTALRDAALLPHPERELVRLAARWTGGFAEITASWGDTIASAGKGRGEPEVQRLEHGGRHVGALTTAFPGEWHALSPVLAEYALLARLRTAAAGAARRRVGERMLDALLSGQEGEGLDGLGQEAFALAVATLPPPTSNQSPPDQAQALDLLAAVGEGYFSERRLVGHATVRGVQAVWLWTTLDLPREARELHLALMASTALDVRLGVSGRHLGGVRNASETVQQAFGEAQQALAATQQARGHSVFHELDPLHALLSEGRLDTLAAQISAQLAALNDDGRTADTLRVYLSHRGTLAELAFAHGIHVNTLRYRLRRAEEVLGGRLSDPALLARLYLAFRAGKGS
ncbi:helix-turn-helix domain-containing protein [Deinococcus arenicola]|uniref:Helix-turn-helix domain-containing protein n=1 Tax=Deinococcus arenicola TaxID=2994950 RepID=A0ABU4DRF3_9DEIO|nr:helix-turn-helix domain-containing protein [Deinococcus sp. ZS9-10]MDV6375010.1 helix-turn-helix domain-containing protein [Deinococcus sp. ZS9-10]